MSPILGPTAIGPVADYPGVPAVGSVGAEVQVPMSIHDHKGVPGQRSVNSRSALPTLSECLPGVQIATPASPSPMPTVVIMRALRAKPQLAPQRRCDGEQVMDSGRSLPAGWRSGGGGG